MDFTAADTYLRNARDRHLEHLMAFLRIPSVSALPAHKSDIADAAAWLADRLRDTGAPEVRLLPTGGNPVVYGRWHVGDGRPTVLLYGHYDVQPVDPIAEWDSPPFEPAIRDGCVFARGASDDKGALYIALAGLDAVREIAGAPAVNLTFLFEGEEEIGSPHLQSFIHEQRERLRADLTVSADGSMWDAETPSISIGNRGLAAMQIDVRGARTDLHSGSYGGAVPNPIRPRSRLSPTILTPKSMAATRALPSSRTRSSRRRYGPPASTSKPQLKSPKKSRRNSSSRIRSSPCG